MKTKFRRTHEHAAYLDPRTNLGARRLRCFRFRMAWGFGITRNLPR